MSAVERFEDLEVWQAARDVANAAYHVSSDGAFSKDHALRDQIHRAAVSILSNIAEGFSRHTNKEFIQFPFIAKGSAAEVQSQLYTVLDQGYVEQERFDGIYLAADVVAKEPSRFITYLKGSG